MSDPRDRLLDLALAEVAGGQAPPDLTERILDAARRRRGWRRLPGGRPGMARPLLAAAAAFAVVIAAWMLWPSSPDTPPAIPPMAEADGPVLVWPPGGDPAPGARIEEGCIVAHIEPFTVRRGDTTIEADANAVLLFQRRSTELLRGRITVEGRHTVGPVVVDGRVSVLLEPTPADPAAFVADYRRDEADPVERRIVTVHAGTAKIGGETFEVGTELTTDWTVEKPPPFEDKAAIDALIAKMQVSFADIDMSDPAEVKTYKDAEDAAGRLRTRLAGDAAAAAYARTALTRFPDGQERRDVTRRLTSVLAQDPHPDAVAALRDLLDRDPDSLDRDAILRLAERGVARALRIVERFATNDPESIGAVLPAVALALRGDARGRPALRWLVANGRVAGSNPDAYFAAAAALHRLGETGPWESAVAFARRRTERALDDGKIAFARWWLARLHYFWDVVRGAAPARSVAYAAQRIAAYATGLENELATAEQIRAMLDRISGS